MTNLDAIRHAIRDAAPIDRHSDLNSMKMFNKLNFDCHSYLNLTYLLTR